MTDPTAGTDALAAQLERRFSRITQVLRGVSVRSGRSVSALLTLRRLDDEGPLRITDLASCERVAQPTMTQIVRRLEQDALVRRTADPDDARAVRVAITDAGRKELVAVRSARAAALAERLDALSGEDRAALAAALPALDRLF